MVSTLQNRPLQPEHAPHADTPQRAPLPHALANHNAIHQVVERNLHANRLSEQKPQTDEAKKNESSKTNASKGFFGSLTQIAKTVGTKITTYGTKALSYTYEKVPGVQFCAESAFSASATIGRACYLHIPGVKKCTSFLANQAVNRLLPQPGSLKRQIEEHKQHLFETTQSSIIEQSCLLISEFIVGFVKNQIVHGKEMDESLRSPLVKKLVHKSFGGHTEYGLFGDVLKTAFETHPDLVQEIIEANLLKAFRTLVDALFKAEKQHPSWLIDFISETLRGYTLDIQQFQERVQQAPLAQGQGQGNPPPTTLPDFHKLAKILLHTAFPEGAKSLDIPLVGASYIGELLMKELEETILPKVCKNLYEIATSEYARDKLLLFFFKLIKDLISRGEIQEDTKGDDIPSPHAPRHLETPYEKTDEFNERLAQFTHTFFDFVDPVLAAFFAKLNIQGLLMKHGHLIIKSLGSITMAEGLNKIIKLLLPLLNKGEWEKKENLLLFKAVPFEYFTKQSQEDSELAFKKQNHEDIRKQTQHILHTLMDDFSGISSISVRSVFDLPSDTEIDYILEKGDLIEHFRLCAWLLLVNIAKEVIKLIFWVLGKARVEQTTHLLYERANSMSLHTSLRPLTSLLFSKLPLAGA